MRQVNNDIVKGVYMIKSVYKIKEPGFSLVYPIYWAEANYISCLRYLYKKISFKIDFFLVKCMGLQGKQIDWINYNDNDF